MLPKPIAHGLSPYDGDCGQELLILSVLVAVIQASLLYFVAMGYHLARTQGRPE
jgi:hypothetical protein